MKPRGFWVTPGRAKALGGALAFLIIGGYTLSVALPLLEGPSVTIDEPRGRSIQGAVTLAGRTKRVSYLSINGLPIALAEDGSFSVRRAYPPGYTEVTVTAKDRFGRVRTDSVSFITLPPAGIATTTHVTEEKIGE